MKVFSRHGFMIIAVVSMLALVLAACNGDDNGDDDTTTDDAVEEVEETTPADEEAVDEDEATETEDEETPATEDDAETDDATPEEDETATDDEAEEDTDTNGDAAAPSGDGQEITIGFIEGWSEGVAASYLWAVMLEDAGFDVTMHPMSEAGILYQGIAGQDIDVYTTAWLPLTHEEYWNNHVEEVDEPELEYIGTWYDEAVLALSVPQYVVDEHGIESLADLADNADLFDSTITGIEPGAGMMRLAAESIMPTYGLDDWTLLESSTAAMLTEFETAYENGEPIVITMWEPHWAYAAWDLHNLEDPEGAWGELDELQVIAWAGFSDEFPEVAEWMSNFELASEDIAELMDYVTVQAEDGEEMEYARQWLDDGGQEIADQWLQ